MTHPLWPRNPSLIDQPIFWRRFPGGGSLIDPLRPFLRSRDYLWTSQCLPGVALEAIPALESVECQANVRPGSFLIMISGNATNAGTSDFVFDVFDKGSERHLSSQELSYMTGAGGKDNARFPGRPLPFIVPHAFVVTEPGVVSVRISNRATAANNIALNLVFAEPRR